MASYEGTNITEEKAVKDAKMQLNDALIESYAAYWRIGSLAIPQLKKKANTPARVKTHQKIVSGILASSTCLP